MLQIAKTMKSHRVRTLLVFFMLIFSVSILTIGPCFASGSLNVLKAGSAFPKADLPDYTGKKIALPDNSGKIALIHFVSVWCDLCETEMALMQLIQTLHGEKGVVSYWVNVGEATKPGLEYASKVSPGFSVLFDYRSDYSAQFGDLRVPVTVVCDRDGLIRGRLIGAITKGGLTKLLDVAQAGK